MTTAPSPPEYKAGSKNALFAKLLMKGKTIAQIDAMDRPDKATHDHVSIARVRRELIAAGQLKAEDSPLRHGGTPRKKPVIQFHPETKAFKIHALMLAKKTDAEILAAGYTKPDLYAVRSQIKKKLEAGKPGKAIVVALPRTLAKNVDKAVASVKRANGKANGHGLALSNGFDVPVVEAILHVPGGGEVRVFSSVDIFPQVYTRAAKASGFIP